MLRRVASTGQLVGLLALLASGGAAAQDAAQDPPDVWVQEVGAPQYFAVLVTDVDRSVEWYRTAFGLRQVGERADGDGWSIVNLRNDRLLVEIIRDDRAQKVERARGFFKVGFQVPDVAVVAERVERATGERPRVLDLPPQGLRILQLRDPDGNIIQLSSPLEVPQ